MREFRLRQIAFTGAGFSWHPTSICAAGAHSGRVTKLLNRSPSPHGGRRSDFDTSPDVSTATGSHAGKKLIGRGDDPENPSYLPCPLRSDGITVAIACYNQGHVLVGAIESTLAQSHQPEHVIVVDDGSTDQTREVSLLYPGVEYKWQANAGLSAARNTALRLARTPYILFLDADDALLPSALEKALEALHQAPEAAFAYGGYVEVFPDGRTRVAEPQRPNEPDLALLSANIIGMHGTVLYRTAHLQKIGGFDEALGACEDWDVYLRLTRVHPVTSYSAIAAQYRRGSGTLSHDFVRMLGAAKTVLSRLSVRTPQERLGVQRGRKLMLWLYGSAAAAKVFALLKSGQVAAAAKIIREATKHDLKFPIRVLRRAFGYKPELPFT